MPSNSRSLGPTLKIFFTPWRYTVHTVDYSFSSKHQTLKIQLTSITLQFWYMPTVLIQAVGLSYREIYFKFQYSIGHPFRTHSVDKNVVPPRASQFIRPDLSSFLNPFPSSDEFAYEAEADPETNGHVNEAETAAVFCAFVVCVVTCRHELASTVLCKRAPSKAEQLKMVPVHT